MHSLLAKRMCSGVHLNINLLSGRALTAVVIISAQMGLITPSHAQDASGSEEGQDGGEIVVQETRTGRSLSDEPIRVEVTDREEIEEKWMMTPGNTIGRAPCRESVSQHV